MTERKYRDSDDNPCSLLQLIKREPEWAASRIRQLESLLDRVHQATLPFYKPKKERAAQCPHTAIYNLYSRIMVAAGFPDIRSLTEERKNKIRKLWQKHLTTLDDWENYFIDALRKPFLQGKNARGWRADFDFMIRESTPIKMQEGKYD